MHDLRRLSSPRWRSNSRRRQTTPLNHLTAPDAISRDILARPIKKWEEGATSKADVPAAIHRNYPMVIEQNFARMDAEHSARFVDQLSDGELKAIAQLYANANADAHRTGKLLLVTANRLDGAHLARLSKFFGYTAVYNAISIAAPTKAQNFAQNAPIMFDAPIVGAKTEMELAVPAPAAAGMMAATTIGNGTGDTITPMQFKPNISMTLNEIYAGYRGMMIGEYAVQAAIWETCYYAGSELIIAGTIGTTFGTGLTWLMQNYASNFYYGTFVNWVGVPATWFTNTLNKISNYNAAQDILDLGTYEGTTAPVMGVPSPAVTLSIQTGGDGGVMGALSYADGDDRSGTCGEWDCDEF